jgi:hypothetical protein
MAEMRYWIIMPTCETILKLYAFHFLSPFFAISRAMLFGVNPGKDCLRSYSSWSAAGAANLARIESSGRRAAAEG